MCLYGNYKWVNIIHPQQKKVVVDACIADEVQILNDNGIKTIGSCCSHGSTGRITEHENGFGTWKEHEYPSHVLIVEENLNWLNS